MYSSLDRFSHVVGLAIVVPIGVAGFVFGDPGRGLAAALGAAVMITAARQTWELRGKPWYWLVLFALLAAHTLLIINFPWPYRHLSYLGLLPFAGADFVIVYGLIRLVQKMVAAI